MVVLDRKDGELMYKKSSQDVSCVQGYIRKAPKMILLSFAETEKKYLLSKVLFAHKLLSADQWLSTEFEHINPFNIIPVYKS